MVSTLSTVMFSRDRRGFTKASPGPYKRRLSAFFASLALLVSALVQSGCAGGAVLDAPVAEVSATRSDLTAIPSRLNFGSVNTGEASTQNIAVANAGASDVTVTTVSISGAGFNLSGVPSGLTLQPGARTNLLVTFAPASTGDVTGNVTITVSLPVAPLAITLSGTGVTGSLYTVRLSWNPSTSSVAGYNIYRATMPEGPYPLLNASPISGTEFIDAGVRGGKIYYYRVTAVATDAAESLYSDGASVTIPTL